jgi:DNA-binding transcriptional LysR family regulator
LTLRQLTCFLAACGEGSFTRAATKLQMAQPSLSAQIRTLEAEVGTPLFARIGGGVEPTPAATRLQPFAERAVAAAAEGEDALRLGTHLKGGVVSFGMFRNSGFYLLEDVVRKLHTRHPEIRVRMPGYNSVDVARAVRSGELDAGLVVLPVVEEGLEVEPIHRDEVLIAASRRSNLKGPVPFELFAREPLILYDAQAGWSDPTTRQLTERATNHGLTLNPAIEIDNLDVALSLVRRGTGVTMVARAAAAHSPFLDSLKLMSFDQPLFDEIALIRRRGSTVSRATKEVIALVRSSLAL